jgi:hypothetical protein
MGDIWLCGGQNAPTDFWQILGQPQREKEAGAQPDLNAKEGTGSPPLTLIDHALIRLLDNPIRTRDYARSWSKLPMISPMPRALSYV